MKHQPQQSPEPWLQSVNWNELWIPFRRDTRMFKEVLPHHAGYDALLKNLDTMAYLIRSLSVYEMTCAALGHPGGSLSEAEILAVLYDYVLRFDARKPDWPARDVFYLSKCHACPGHYSAMALAGYFPVTDLTQYGVWGSHLESHPDCRKTPGVEISGGSLGQIPGVAVGRALGIRQAGPEHAARMVYALLGDGECNEGSVWEAFMAAGHYKLDNLVFIIDYNKVQAKGFVQREMGLEPLADKLAAFNLQVSEVRNGHDVAELVGLFNQLRTQRRGRPTAVILNTVKGNKIEMCEYNVNWHTSAPREVSMACGWLQELWERDGRRLGVPESFPQRLGEAIRIVPPLHDNPDQITEKQA